MEDDDLFFEDDVAEETPAQPAAKGSTKTASKAPAGKAAASKAAGGSPAPPRPQEGDEEEPGATMSVTIAVLGMIVALLIGFILGVVVEQRRIQAAPAGLSAAGGAGAPALTPQQLQQGQLPAGHPNFGNIGGGAGSGAAGSTKGSVPAKTTKP